FDPQSGCGVTFCGRRGPLPSQTADRRGFLGRNGTAAAPVGLLRPLAGTTGVGVDPCAALRCVLDLAPGETRDMVIVLGAAQGEDAARDAVREYRDVTRAEAAIR